MAISRAVIDHLQVQPGHAAGLSKRDTAWKGGQELAHLHGKGSKSRMKAELQNSRDEIDREQELLWADDCRSLLLVFQAMRRTARTCSGSTSVTTVPSSPARPVRPERWT